MHHVDPCGPFWLNSLHYLISYLTFHIPLDEAMIWKLLFALVQQVIGISECHDCQPARSTQLLQTSRSSQQGSPIFTFDEDKMWGLDKSLSWHMIQKDKDCILRFPAFNLSGEHGELESRLSLGRCLRPWPSLERWRVDLALPASHGRTHPGANPSFVPLPETLKSAFPSGKWLAVSRFGWARCPGMQDFDRSEWDYLTNLWCSGSYAAVLGRDFSIQAVSKIQMEGGDWANAISDVRLWPLGEDLIVSRIMANSEYKKLKVLKGHCYSIATGQLDTIGTQVCLSFTLDPGFEHSWHLLTFSERPRSVLCRTSSMKFFTHLWQSSTWAWMMVTLKSGWIERKSVELKVACTRNFRRSLEFARFARHVARLSCTE